MLYDMEYFWTCLEHIPDGVGYGLFTPMHLFLIALVVLLVITVSGTYKSSNRETKLIIRRTIARVLIISDIIKLIVIGLNGVDVTMYLPLEICSFAAYSIVGDSIWPDNEFFSPMLPILFLPGAIFAMAFPTTTPLPFLNYFTLHQFFFHGLIVAYVVARFSSGEIKISYSDVWKSIFKICVIASFVYVIDVIFNRNFMFLTDTEGNFMLDIIKERAGEGISYTIGLIIFTVIVIHIFALIFKGIEKVLIRYEGI